MRSLNPPQTPLDFEAILEFAFRDPLLQSPQSFFDLGHKAAANGFFLLLPSRRATEDVGLFPTRNRNLLHFHFRPNLLKIVLQQLCRELLSWLRRVPTRYCPPC